MVEVLRGQRHSCRYLVRLVGPERMEQTVVFVLRESGQQITCHWSMAILLAQLVVLWVSNIGSSALGYRSRLVPSPHVIAAAKYVLVCRQELHRQHAKLDLQLSLLRP